MSLTAFIIIISFLFFALIVTVIIALIDWRSIIVRKFGPNYKKGLAHILVGNAWLYRESELYFEGDDAMTYMRKNGDSWISDILPDQIGFDYDEYTGRRIYKVYPGSSIAFSDRGDAPGTNYPSNLLSVHVLDRTGVDLATSVSASGGTNWKVIILTGLAIIIIIVVLFMTGLLKLPGNTGATKTAPQNQPTITTPAQTPPNIIH